MDRPLEQPSFLTQVERHSTPGSGPDHRNGLGGQNHLRSHPLPVRPVRTGGDSTDANPHETLLLQDVAKKGVWAQNKTWGHVRIKPIQGQVPPLNRVPLQATHQRRQQCLLSMKTIFSLIKDAAGRAFHHSWADLLAAMGRQAVQNDGRRISSLH